MKRRHSSSGEPTVAYQTRASKKLKSENIKQSGKLKRKRAGSQENTPPRTPTKRTDVAQAVFEEQAQRTPTSQTKILSGDRLNARTPYKSPSYSTDRLPMTSKRILNFDTPQSRRLPRQTQQQFTQNLSNFYAVGVLGMKTIAESAELDDDSMQGVEEKRPHVKNEVLTSQNTSTSYPDTRRNSVDMVLDKVHKQFLKNHQTSCLRSSQSVQSSICNNSSSFSQENRRWSGTGFCRRLSSQFQSSSEVNMQNDQQDHRVRRRESLPAQSVQHNNSSDQQQKDYFSKLQDRNKQLLERLKKDEQDRQQFRRNSLSRQSVDSVQNREEIRRSGAPFKSISTCNNASNIQHRQNVQRRVFSSSENNSSFCNQLDIVTRSAGNNQQQSFRNRSGSSVNNDNGDQQEVERKLLSRISEEIGMDESGEDHQSSDCFTTPPSQKLKATDSAQNIAKFIRNQKQQLFDAYTCNIMSEEECRR
eukprot:TRINITY_DN2991_c0_g1_i6.p1 TRINITY_DN2991_c0_g1~~TRINITY_DN2991_c0_g1_i6.p1  ORF type:complete len:474 (+),score=40.79 TRINITY_DN2991_c0_g1_i6:113-1534(+)